MALPSAYLRAFSQFFRRTTPISPPLWEHLKSLNIAWVTRRGRKFPSRQYSIPTRITPRVGIDIAGLVSGSSLGVNRQNLVTIKPSSSSGQPPVDSTKFCLANLRSVRNKTAYVRNMVESKKLDIFAITESFLGQDDDPSVIQEVTPDTHTFYNVPRTDRQGGGIALMSHKSIVTRQIETTNFSSFEHGLFHLRARNIIFHILLVYRPPSSSFPLFLTEFQELLGDIFSLGNLILMGDFNVHMDDPSHSNTKKFQDVIDFFTFHQHVNFPTHESGHILDLVITREGSGLVEIPSCGELLSDHYSIPGKILLPGRQKLVKQFEYRPLKTVPEDVFRSELESALLSYKQEDDLDQHLDSFNSCLVSVINNVAPIKRKQFFTREESPWYDSSMAHQKRKVRKAEREWRACKNDQSKKEAFSILKKDLCKSMASARAVYYKNLIEQNKSDHRKLFNIISSLNKPTQDSCFPLPPESQSLPEYFGEFFVNKIKNIRLTFQDADTDEPTNSPHTGSEMDHFDPATLGSVREIVKSSRNKSSSLDPFPTALVKSNIDLLLSHLVTIINKSLTTSHFPSQLKGAVVVPILKKASLPPILKNFRPISNLPFLSKILEKVVVVQLEKYITENNLMPPHQSAYRKRHSTETALIKIQNDIMCGIDDGQVAFLFLLDLSAAFDTLDHEILLHRLHNDFGITRTALAWFSSYLTERSQSISIDGQLSSPFPLECGVPQGSVLGPILFSLYVTPLHDLIRTFGMSVHSYADDTQIYISVPANEAHDPNFTGNMSACLDAVSRWMAKNKLKLNASKTEAIVLGTPQALRSFVHPKITIDGCQIAFSSKVKNLGAIIDQHFSLDDHVAQTCRSCNFFLYNLRRIRPCLDTKTCTMAVQSLVISRLDYCNALLMGTTSKNIQQLQLVQNMAARTIFQLKKSDHISDTLHSLHWLPIHKRILFKILLLTWKCRNGMAPEYLQSLISIRQCERTTRSTERRELLVPRTRLVTFGDRAFSSVAPRVWNDLPVGLRDTESLERFKRLLKAHLF